MKILKILTLCLVLCIFTICAFAHPGDTDSDGGHYNHATGEYHYHHGYPAHSHVGGCPYDYDDETGSSSGSSSGGSYYIPDDPPKTSDTSNISSSSSSSGCNGGEPWASIIYLGAILALGAWLGRPSDK